MMQEHMAHNNNYDELIVKRKNMILGPYLCKNGVTELFSRIDIIDILPMKPIRNPGWILVISEEDDNTKTPVEKTRTYFIRDFDTCWERIKNDYHVYRRIQEDV